MALNVVATIQQQEGEEESSPRKRNMKM